MGAGGAGHPGSVAGLLRATQVPTGDLALPVVLQPIVEAARGLVGARYAALGVIAPDGGLAEFVHVGMPDDAVQAIGHLPQQKGLLGALIDDPRPIRLRRISDDPRSSGFPPGHPPMTSFLGVPIRIGDEVFGNLYLTESTRGQFSADDEELTLALAAAAAAAIDRARLYQAARARGEWLHATAAITRRLLSADSVDVRGPLRLIAERAREIAQADLVSIVLPTPAGGQLRVEVAVGEGAAQLCGRAVPMAGSLAGRAFSTGEPVRVAQPNELPGLVSMACGDGDVGPVLVVPLRGSQRVHGVLTAARVRGRSGFTADDLDMAGSFANPAAVALELAQARAEQQRAAMLEDRQRIAADLHDHVIQRLFAAGLSLQAVAAVLGPGRPTERILATVTDLDRTIAQIRTSIFALHQTPQATPRGLRARLLDVAAEQADTLGFHPALHFSGLLDTLPDTLTEDLEAVLREALSNIARHAHAHTVEVDVTATPDRITLQVSDDGIGLGPTTRRSGLANLRRRAERHGGTLTLTQRRPRGTRLTWAIPHS